MIANVSAADDAGNSAVISDGENAEEPDIPDLYFEDDFNVTLENINKYFPNGVLASNYSNCNLTFSGEFNNLGVLTISQRNVTIDGKNSLFINTVLDVAGSDVVLSNLSFVLNDSFYDNEFAAILVRADNVALNNINIDCIALEDTTAYGIYSSGTSRHPVDNLTIFNSTINFTGQNYNADVYNYALRMDYSRNAIVYNNTINTKLVLRGINFNTGRVASDSDYSLAVSAIYCDDLLFIGNDVTCDAIGRSFGFPTLDCFFMWGSNNAFILNNSFEMTDFFTYRGVDNYLYGLDIYSLANLTVANNDISINTTGGRLSAGAAYPIQLTGPLSNVTIVYNDLCSVSNGPNIGIYSSNSGGNTALYIMYNRINITGLAGEDSWALVAGIEGQDSNDIIMNNLIEVHSTGDVDENTNIYGISYSQSSPGDHSFDIINNTVLSDGFYSVYLESAVNSTITHNTLISYQDDIEDGHNGYKKGDGVHESEMSYNNLVFNEFDYNAQRANDIDSGYVFNYTAVENDRNLSNIIDASGIAGKRIFDIPNFNPLIRNDTIRHHTNGGAAANYQEDEDSDVPAGPVGPSIPDAGEGNSSSNIPSNGSNTGGNSSSVSPQQGNSTGGGDSPSVNPKPRDIPEGMILPGDSQNTVDNSTETNSSSEDKTEYVELPDTPDGDNGYVEDYNYHPRTPSNNQQSNKPINPANGNSTQNSGLNLRELLVAYVNSNTEGGENNVQSYGGRSQATNQTSSGPSVTGSDAAIGESKSTESSDSSAASSSSAGESNSGGTDSSTSKNAYELNDVVKTIKDNVALGIVLIILCLICLVVGYKRQKTN
ncbi:right-handed parallel beta-helix repeat-containing protein [Methanobrevibacter sp.]|uniref:right-handed parallel beta-helix repeat-containing protein n=1 Tax=Methanobrevibacter sp. TaxID=66852 RepID=UPI0038906930